MKFQVCTDKFRSVSFKFLHLFQINFQSGNCFFIAVFHCEYACPRLQNFSEFQYFADIHTIFRCDLVFCLIPVFNLSVDQECSFSLIAFQNTNPDQILKCRSDTGTADSKFHNHLVFRRNLFTDVPFSGFNIFLQILNDLIRNIDCFYFHPRALPASLLFCLLGG